MGVPSGVWVAAVIIVVLVAWMTFWVTNKAYSRKWEDQPDPDDNHSHKR
jgi:heme/copper-type cytochrome/quinol oxidase subunit 2